MNLKDNNQTTWVVIDKTNNIIERTPKIHERWDESRAKNEADYLNWSWKADRFISVEVKISFETATN